MKKRILIAGTANTTGHNVARALAAAKVEFLGCDCAIVNAADVLCTNFAIPRTIDSGYLSAVLRIIDDHNVTHVIPSNDHDVRAIAAERQQFERRGVIINGLGANTLACLDKLATSQLFSAASVLTPHVINCDVSCPSVPFVLRSRKVGGSKKFTHIVREPTPRNISSIPESHWNVGIVTQHIEGAEFTVDVLCDQASQPLSVVPRLRRQISKLGDVHHAELFQHVSVIRGAAHAAQSLQLVGMNCLQCIVDRNGAAWFFEVNPRPGSGIDLTVEGGVNMPKLWLDVLDGKKTEFPEPDWGLQMVRFAAARFFK